MPQVTLGRRGTRIRWIPAIGRAMRFAFAALLLLSTAAVASPHGKGHDSDNSKQNAAPQQSSHSRAPGTVPQHRGSHDRGGLPGVANGIHRESERRHHGGGMILYPFPPYPTTWPYPPYPYPPGSIYYPDTSDDNDDDNGLHGMVVPGEVPMVRAFWYYCDTPDGYYPYVKTCNKPWTSIPVSPPPPGAATPLSFADWQWCEESKSFFPYVTACKEGFAPMPATAPSGTTPEVANWYFCEDPKGYAPYVVQCKKDWRAVPAVPPPSVKITVKDEKTK